jgi:hypothetical protein
MNLIDQAIKSSEIIKNIEHNFIWKITGRYVIQNIDKLVLNCPRGVDLYINSRDYPSKWVDFFLVGFDLVNYSNLLGNDIDSYRPTENGEALLRKRIDDGDFNNFKIINRFNVTPKIVGVRGYDAKSYTSFSNNAKYYLRVLMNRFLPQIWI